MLHTYHTNLSQTASTRYIIMSLLDQIYKCVRPTHTHALSLLLEDSTDTAPYPAPSSTPPAASSQKNSITNNTSNYWHNSLKEVSLSGEKHMQPSETSKYTQQIDRYKKLSCVTGLLAKKIRKINYEFWVRMERTAK